MFKVGLVLFMKEGLNGLRRIQEISGRPIFLDLKFHDIPETVAHAVSSLMSSEVPVRFMTIHACGGEGVLRAAVEEAKGRVQILGVTVLTSMEQKDLEVSGEHQDLRERVLTLARITKKAGGAGVVCSSQEAKAVKATLGPDFIVVTPGIRSSWALVPGDDQRRITTPKEAILNGADYLVVGRPIAKSPDPVEASVKIAQEIHEALNQRFT
jgi:orotidine-5'-phosphate decarboxylase